jgi:DNA-binding beta-propeller fold protein YncE
MRIRAALFSLAVIGLITLVPQAPTRAQGGLEADCNRPTAEPVAYVPIDGEPLFVQTTQDGCWLFVRTTGGLTVFQRSNGTMEPIGARRLLPRGGTITLTHDQSILIARGPGQLVFFDVPRLLAGDANAEIGQVESSRLSNPAFNFPGTLLVTPDDKHLLVTNHQTAWLAIVDLEHVRLHGPGPAAIVGGFATAAFPTNMRLSPDSRWLYLAQGRVPDRLGAPAICRPSLEIAARGTDAVFRPSAISILDMDNVLAGREPRAHSDIVAGCESSGTRLSPDGYRLYNVPHGDDVLLAHDTTPVDIGAPPRQIATVPVGFGPRDVALVDDGRTIVVAHDEARYLTVIDASRVEAGAEAVRGIIPTRSNVAGLTVSADGRTLFVPNRDARTLQVIDLDRLSLEPAPVLSERQRR